MSENFGPDLPVAADVVVAVPNGMVAAVVVVAPKVGVLEGPNRDKLVEG